MARLAAFIVVTLFLLAVFPMQLTTLAPAEIIAYQPEVIKAPIDGVIDESASRDGKKTYRFTLEFNNGKWKIANVTRLD